MRLSTTFLSVEQFGVFSLLTAFRAFFGLFLINPVGQHINRHTHEWFSNGSLLARLHRYNHYIFFVALLAVMLVAIWLLLRGTLVIEMVSLASIAMGLSVYAGTWNGTLVPMLNMVGFRAMSVSLEVFTGLLVLLGSVFLVLHHNSGVYWFAGAVFGLGVVALLAWKLLQKQLVNSVGKPSTVKLLDKTTFVSFCLPLAAAAGFMWLLTSGYRFLVEWGWGASALGLMAVGFGIASQMWSICETLAMQFLFPHFYKAISDGDKAKQQQAYTDLINTLMPLYLILLGVTLVSGGWVLAVLTDIKFHDAYPYVFFGAIIEWCRVMAGLLSQAAQVTKRTSYNIVPYACSGLFAVCACIVASTLHAPLINVVFLLVAAGFLLLATMSWQMIKLMPIMIEWRNLIGPALFSIVLGLGGVVYGVAPKPALHSVVALAVVGLLAIVATVIYLKSSKAYQALLSVELR